MENQRFLVCLKLQNLANEAAEGPQKFEPPIVVSCTDSADPTVLVIALTFDIRGSTLSVVAEVQSNQPLPPRMRAVIQDKKGQRIEGTFVRGDLAQETSGV